MKSTDQWAEGTRGNH